MLYQLSVHRWIIKQFNLQGKNHAHLKDIAFLERTSEENLVEDILIGEDQQWNIGNGKVRRGENWLVAMNI